MSKPVNYVALGDSTGVGVGARKGGGYVARLFERGARAKCVCQFAACGRQFFAAVTSRNGPCANMKRGTRAGRGPYLLFKEVSI